MAESVEVISLVPDVEPLFFTLEPRLEVFKIFEVYKTVGTVALGAAIVTVQLAAADALFLIRFFPCEFVWLELSASMFSIAPRLSFTPTAGAPEVCLTFLHVDFVAAALGHHGELCALLVGLVSDIPICINSTHAPGGDGNGRGALEYFREVSSKHSWLNRSVNLIIND